MTGWGEVAEEMERHLDDVEALLGDVDAPAAVSWGPLDRPAVTPTPAERDRLERLEARAADLRARLRDAMNRIGGDLADSGKRRDAARTYRKGSLLS